MDLTTNNAPTNQSDNISNMITTQTYLENILRLNIGTLGTFYFTYTGSTDWRDRAYKGVIEEVGRDHFIISDPKNNKHILLQFIYLDFAEFDEAITTHYK